MSTTSTDPIEATYENGCLRLDEPLDVPERARVTISITGSKAPPELPPAPRITGDELSERIRKYGVSAPSLPVNFSRADIYNDHD